MEQHRILKKVLGSCFEGGRPLGRPRNRWEEVIQTDASKLLRIRKWKAAARDKEWRKKVGEAMVRKRTEASQKKEEVSNSHCFISTVSRMFVEVNASISSYSD
jgi:hypothetical protein